MFVIFVVLISVLFAVLLARAVVKDREG